MEYCELEAYFDNRQFRNTKDKVINLNNFYNVITDDFDIIKNKLSKNLLIEYLKITSHEINIHIEDAIHYAKITPLENRRIKLLIHYAKELKIEQLKYEKELISYGGEIIKDDELELESLYYLDPLKQIAFLPNATDIENRIIKESEPEKVKNKKRVGNKTAERLSADQLIIKDWTPQTKTRFINCLKNEFSNTKYKPKDINNVISYLTVNEYIDNSKDNIVIKEAFCIALKNDKKYQTTANFNKQYHTTEMDYYNFYGKGKENAIPEKINNLVETNNIS